MTPRTTAVVLAGGRSRRFGDADKLLVDIDGRPMVAEVVAAATAITDASPPVVATSDAIHERSLADAIDTDVRFVHDDPTFEGPLAGLAAAAAAIDTPRLVVLGGDMPQVSPAIVAELEDRSDGSAVVPVVEGERQPLHAVYPRSPLVDALADVRSNASVRELLSLLAPVTYVSEGDLSDELVRSVWDIDTRADLEVVGGD